MPRRLTLLLAFMLATVSCGDDDSRPRSYDAEVYTAVVRALAPERPGAEVDEVDGVVFVGPINDDVSISLDAQASVVEDLEDFATIRFVDDRKEAVGSDEGKPVIEDGVLVLVGDVPPGRSPVVRAVRYVDLDDVARFRVEVRGSDDVWEVVEIEPRGDG